jgi:DNA-binding IclR family transcriptional regulator
MSDLQSSDNSLSWIAQQVALLLADSRTGATATQLSGQLFMPREQVDVALRELLTHGYATRSGRRWRPALAPIAPRQDPHLRSA